MIQTEKAGTRAVPPHHGVAFREGGENHNSLSAGERLFLPEGVFLLQRFAAFTALSGIYVANDVGETLELSFSQGDIFATPHLAGSHFEALSIRENYAYFKVNDSDAKQ